MIEPFDETGGNPVREKINQLIQRVGEIEGMLNSGRDTDLSGVDSISILPMPRREEDPVPVVHHIPYHDIPFDPPLGNPKLTRDPATGFTVLKRDLEVSRPVEQEEDENSVEGE